MPSPKTDSRANLRVVESFLKALESMDHDAVLALLADDVVYQNVPFPADRGKAKVARTLKSFTKVLTSLEIKTHHIAERDGVVLTERTDILIGPMLYLDIWVCGTFQVKDGKIVLWRDYFDVGSAFLKLATSPFRWLRYGRKAAAPAVIADAARPAIDRAAS